MSIIEAIILGILQGLTEFLPISSSGHLVLASKIFDISGDFIFFSVILHVATLLAVMLYFRKEVWFLIKHPFSKTAKQLYLATLPTIILVLIFEGFIENSFDGKLLPFCFFFTAILLIITQFVSTKNQNKELDYKGSFAMGIMQGIAVLPGISRSGATICTGIMLGYDKVKSAKFSFLMSIPIIFASMLYEIYKLIKIGGGQLFPFQTFISALFAFIVGLLAIKLMLWVVKKVKFYWFSIYLVAITIISFIFLY